MEKKEMSFIEKAKAAAGEISNDINENRAMIVLANDHDSDNLYINMYGKKRMLIETLVCAALDDAVVEEILTSSLEYIKKFKGQNNKYILWKRW